MVAPATVHDTRWIKYSDGEWKKSAWRNDDSKRAEKPVEEVWFPLKLSNEEVTRLDEEEANFLDTCSDSDASVSSSDEEDDNSPGTVAIPAVRFRDMTFSPSNGNMKDSPHRTIIEFCCGENSVLGRSTGSSVNCNVIRVTQRHDVTTEEGLRFVLENIKNAGPNVLLWASMPCTGGSPWFHINKVKPGGDIRLKKHVALFSKIWRAFQKACAAVDKVGGFIAIEWPRNCSYWHLRRVKMLVRAHSLVRADFEGCALGLTSIVSYKPIKKPWTVKTNCPLIASSLSRFRCNGSHEHAPCAGPDTRRSEDYTDMFAKVVHVALANTFHIHTYPSLHVHNQPSRSLDNKLETSYPGGKSRHIQ